MPTVPDGSMPRTLLPVTACLLIAGCGGRAAVPPSTNAVTRAERVDGRPAPPPPDVAPNETAPVRLAPDEVVEEDLGAVVPPKPAMDVGSVDGSAPSGTVMHGRDRDLHHIIRRGQTLYSLARLYGVDLQDLMRANGIVDPTKVQAGRPILIPGGAGRPSLPPESGPSADSGAPEGPGARGARGALLAWPLHGAITAAYGRRGKRAHHSGLDIDGRKGDPIHAAGSGIVVRAGADGLYGRVVILDHGEGLTTLYAHASRLLVKAGDRVRAGERIAEVGGSGNARGTHLHFEVRRDGRPIDPMPYLRSRPILTAGTH
jgi:hypothetical protein